MIEGRRLIYPMSHLFYTRKLRYTTRWIPRGVSCQVSLADGRWPFHFLIDGYRRFLAWNLNEKETEREREFKEGNRRNQRIEPSRFFLSFFQFFVQMKTRRRPDVPPHRHLFGEIKGPNEKREKAPTSTKTTTKEKKRWSTTTTNSSNSSSSSSSSSEKKRNRERKDEEDEEEGGKKNGRSKQNKKPRRNNLRGKWISSR